MVKTLTKKTGQTITDNINVLFISIDGTLRPDIKKVVESCSFSYEVSDFLSLLTSSEIDNRKISAAIIDIDSVSTSHQKMLFEVIQLLDRVNIPTVLFGNTDHINLDHFKMLNVIEKRSAASLVPLIKMANVYHQKLVELENGGITNAIKDNHTQQLENQLKMAGVVQRDFLPQVLPDSSQLKWAVVFAPADWVSGDIYDVARLDETHTGFYIADAVGHSMPAALLTMFLKQAIQMRQTIGNEYKIFTPLEVISTLNQKMFAQHLRGCQFATCCYCLLNTEKMTLDYCRAGHPYPILISRDKDPVQLQTRGSLLGVFDDAQFEQGTVQLYTGDKLLLYSDGAEPFIGTAHSDTSFSLSKEFMDIVKLPVKQFAEEFEKLVKSSKKQAESDDITLIALEVI